MPSRDSTQKKKNFWFPDGNPTHNILFILVLIDDVIKCGR